MATKRYQFGYMPEFRLKEDDFNSWIERFELYVSLNEVNTHKQRMLPFQVTMAICQLETDSNRFEDIKNMLSDYINPKPNVINERYKFKERRHATNESVIQFIRYCI